MRFGRTFATVLYAAAFLVRLNAWAVVPPEQRALSNFDRRSNLPSQALGETPAQRSAVNLLQERISNIQVDFDEFLGTPRFVRSPDGFLTGPGGTGRAVRAETARRVPVSDPHRPVKNFLNEYAALFGHGAEALADARTNRDFVAAHNGVRTVVWQQQVDDIPVFEAVLMAHTTKQGELVNVSSRFLPDAKRAVDVGMPNRASVQAAPPISAQQAVALAAQNIGQDLRAGAVSAVDPAAVGAEKRQRFRAPALLGDTDARLVWLPMDRTQMRLCWEVLLTSRTRGEMFRVLIDAQTGEALVRHCLTEYISDATYRVYTSDSPSPYSPGCSVLCTTQPALTSRGLVTLSAIDTTASPNGWINDGDNTTLGNNVDAHLDKNGDNVPDPGSRPTGSPFRVFDCPMDLAQEPVTYTNAAVVQLFYWNNWMHDKLYELGFTEAAGNFQTDNFGRGGYGNDAVQADAQDGSGVNNANFSTPPDGSPGRMQMFLFNGPTPDRDGDFDADVVLHEYTHGLSNRRVGGGVGISALQTGGMGEGWSDFYALSLLSESGDDVNGNYAAGGYVTYQLSGMTQNYYFGIRRYPYTTDMTKNPLTFKDIDPAQASSHTGIPRSPIIGSTANEVHNMGEVWCVTLWEARARLITKYGFAVGNQLILQLVTDGMNLSPANPNFLQARDAIIQADLVDTGGANRNELWAAFAKRGMGFSATSPASSTTTGLVEAYDVPDDLRVSPSAGLTAIGRPGGPFSPQSQLYSLINAGSISLTWQVSKTATWLDVSPTSGILTAGQTSPPVTVSINSAANLLPVGAYGDQVIFSNQASGVSQQRIVSLQVTTAPFTILLTGNYIQLPVDNSAGRLMGIGNSQGAKYNPAGTGGWSGVDFWVWGTPVYNYTIATGGSTFKVNGAGWTSGPVVTDTSAGSLHRAVISGSPVSGLVYTRVISFDDADQVVKFIDTLSNTGSSSIAQVATLDNADPDQDYPAYRLYATLNDVVTVLRSNDLVSAAGPNSGLTVGFGSPDTNTAEDASGFSNTNPYPILASPSDPNGAVADIGINLAANYGTLTPGQTGTNTWYMVFGSNATAAVNNYRDRLTRKLTLSVPLSATEGDGVLTGQGIIFLPAVLATNLTISLTSSDTSEATVPPTVTVPAGQTNATFDITIVDDAILDGDQSATITAAAAGYTSGSGTIIVHDNETATLTVTVPPSATEGDGVLTNAGVVAVSAPVAADVTVTLNSSDTTEVVVPATVTVLAGQTNANFNITIVDDTVIDGPQTATITAHVQNWIDGSSSVTVLDNDYVHLTVTPATGLSSTGPQSGPFTPSSQIYALSNTGPGLMTWSASKSATWLTVAPAGGSLAGGGNANVTVSINASANNLFAGSYTDVVSLINLTNGDGSTDRPVTLTVEVAPPTTSFTATPTNGVVPLTAAFTDNSTGTITNRLWDFGDGGTTNITMTSVGHTYILAGSYTVSLTASGPLGANTLTRTNLITVMPCISPPSGLVSWWPGDGAGNDLQGGNHGVLTNGVTFAAGMVGRAFHIDGLDDAVVVGNPTNLQLQSFTIDAWIRRASTTQVTRNGSDGELFTYGMNGYGLGLHSDGRLLLTKMYASEVASSLLRVTDTNLHHVAVTKSGSTVVFYVDGVAEAAAAYDPGFSFTTPAAIGAEGGTLAGNFYGDIDELEIFNRALAASEIQAIYNAAQAGQCKPTGLSVSPATGLNSTGIVGGWFTPASQLYTLLNNGTNDLNWSADASAAWVSFSVTNGSLAGGAWTNITVTINSNANSLAVGVYSNTVTFTNLTNGDGTTNRIVTLTVTPPRRASRRRLV